MARTSKTKIRGGSGEQSDRMSRALEAGTAGRQRAHEALLETKRAGQRDITQAALQVGQLAEQGESRQQRGAIAGRQAGIADKGQALQERGQDIDAADRGIEGTPPVEEYLDKPEPEEQPTEEQPTEEQPPAAPGGADPQGVPSMRADEIERLRAQAEKPLEYTGSSGYQDVQGPRMSKRRQTREQRSDLMAQQQLELNEQRLAKGAYDYERSISMPPGPKRDAAQLSAMEAQEKAIGQSQEFIGKVMSDDIDFDAEKIAKSFPENPDMARMVASGEVDKGRVVQFLRARLGSQQLTYMATSGQWPPHYDATNPVMRQFTTRMQETAASFRAHGNLMAPHMREQGDPFDQAAGARDQNMLQGAWQGIRTPDERNEFLTKTTARLMMESERYRSQMEVIAKASGTMDRIGELEQSNMQKDQTIAELVKRLEAVGAPPETEMRQGMDEQGNPVGSEVKVKKHGPEDEARVKAMQDEDQRTQGQQNRPIQGPGALKYGGGWSG